MFDSFDMTTAGMRKYNNWCAVINRLPAAAIPILEPSSPEQSSSKSHYRSWTWNDLWLKRISNKAANLLYYYVLILMKEDKNDEIDKYPCKEVRIFEILFCAEEELFWRPDQNLAIWIMI